MNGYLDEDSIKSYVNTAHSIAISKGFWDEDKDKSYWEIDLDRIICLIVSELSEAVESHRKGKHANVKDFEEAIEVGAPFEESFQCFIKDSFEDEIADAFIRLFDLCGYLNYQPKNVYNSWLEFRKYRAQKGSLFFLINNTIKNLSTCQDDGYLIYSNLDDAFSYLILVADSSDFLEKPVNYYIEKKMEYNKTRPPKHGKLY